MPFACDLGAAPVGSWAEYEAKDPPSRDPVRTRIALVSKGPDGNTIEWTYDVSRRTDLVIAFLFAPGKEPPGELKRRVFQDGPFEPMEMPVPPSPTPGFYVRIDPRSLIGSEEITVRAGTFSARRHHYLTPFGENVDVWISETAWPICLIKLDAEQKQMPQFPGRFSYELIAMGSGAQPQITRPAIPYDLEVLKKRDDEQRIRERRPDNAPRVGDTIAP
jgi:hypothetical protein